MIDAAGQRIVGRPFDKGDEPFHVPEFDPGHGMSAGAIAPAWWRDTGIPILTDRYEAGVRSRG